MLATPRPCRRISSQAAGLTMAALPSLLPCWVVAGPGSQHAGIHACPGGRPPHVHEGAPACWHASPAWQRVLAEAAAAAALSARCCCARCFLFCPACVVARPQRGCAPNFGWNHALTAARRLSATPWQVENGRVYCLPDMYEVQDRSLADIQYVLNPTFTRERAARGRRRLALRHACRRQQRALAGPRFASPRAFGKPCRRRSPLASSMPPTQVLLHLSAPDPCSPGRAQAGQRINPPAPGHLPC